MDTLLIRHCNVLRLQYDRPPAIDLDQAIVVDGPRIRAIMPDAQLGEHETQEVVDARGMLAMPGLINTHAHAPMVIFRGLAEDCVAGADIQIVDAAGYRFDAVGLEEAREFVSALRDKSRAGVHYLEMNGAQHAFEIFHSVRSQYAVRAATAFLEAEHAKYLG